MTKCANRLSGGGGCNYRENRLPGQPVMVFMFDQNGVEVFLDERRGNFLYVVKNVKTFSPQRHRGTEVFMYKTDLLVEITITDTHKMQFSRNNN